jgi:hypothetical protein
MAMFQLNEEMLKRIEEIKNKALQERMKKLEKAPYYKVDYPLSEYMFGCLKPGVPYRDYPEHIFNPRNTPQLKRRYQELQEERIEQEEEKISIEEMRECVIDYFEDDTEWDVDYKHYGLEVNDLSNEKKIRKAIFTKHDLSNQINVLRLFKEHCE